MIVRDNIMWLTCCVVLVMVMIRGIDTLLEIR